MNKKDYTKPEMNDFDVRIESLYLTAAKVNDVPTFGNDLLDQPNSLA